MRSLPTYLTADSTFCRPPNPTGARRRFTRTDSCRGNHAARFDRPMGQPRKRCPSQPSANNVPVPWVGAWTCISLRDSNIGENLVGGRETVPTPFQGFRCKVRQDPRPSGTLRAGPSRELVLQSIPNYAQVFVAVIRQFCLRPCPTAPLTPASAAAYGQTGQWSDPQYRTSASSWSA